MFPETHVESSPWCSEIWAGPTQTIHNALRLFPDLYHLLRSNKPHRAAWSLMYYGDVVSVLTTSCWCVLCPVIDEMLCLYGVVQNSNHMSHLHKSCPETITTCMLYLRCFATQHTVCPVVYRLLMQLADVTINHMPLVFDKQYII